MTRAGWMWICLLGLSTGTASAQPYEPISRFVADARGAFPRFKADPSVASALRVETSNLPTRGLGAAVGLHWYPVRGRRLSFGIGGEMMGARGRRTAGQTSGTAARPTVTTRVTSISPQVSLNFGKRDGWSYLSGGIGRARVTSEREDAPRPGGAQRTQAINYGGGARWFTGDHLAFSVDLRWYAVSPREGSAEHPGFPRFRMMVISAGVSVH